VINPTGRHVHLRGFPFRILPCSLRDTPILRPIKSLWQADPSPNKPWQATLQQADPLPNTDLVTADPSPSTHFVTVRSFAQCRPCERPSLRPVHTMWQAVPSPSTDLCDSPIVRPTKTLRKAYPSPSTHNVTGRSFAQEHFVTVRSFAQHRPCEKPILRPVHTMWQADPSPKQSHQTFKNTTQNTREWEVLGRSGL